ncbi:MAG: LacI family transcriptional regulator [Firmicutes bacterium]|nr:LacI family transcriptional regulator [Bacillota bacterium]
MPGLAEVARAAGVSPSTASRALTRPELVRRAVVARVRQAAEQLGYVPNHVARSLRRQESRTLGLLVPDNTNPFFAEVARGIEAACFRAGYTLLLGNSDRSLEKEAAQARVFVEKRVDGVLFFTTSDHSAPTIAWLLERGVPVVLLERRSPGPAVDCVVSDNAGGVRAAIAHLAEQGHRRIACLVGDLHASQYAERLAAYERAVRELGLAAAPELVRAGLITYADGQQAALALLRGPAPPTALFCATDTLAIGALRGARLAGRRVPDEVAVAGYGDIELAAYTQPPLTSVAQDKQRVGELAVQVLLRRLAQRAQGQPWQPEVLVVPARLVVRESSSPPLPAGAPPPPGPPPPG